ncbi:ABC-2 transporter permease [Lentibacillus jeotgali]|uniref:ABC-2 transporter permease n=1 Tax=Lentibacillus jeotgali TaxID=558169 RepID=UPI00026277E1|nr:ABC-2 transporter permease [Lentibacillus jeotgali]
MKGLLLTNYYLVYRSILAYIGLAILVSGVILYFAGAMVSGIAALLIILLMTLPSLEVIKTESKSGYDKYVLTLPVSRKNIVQSHYIFYFSVVIIGAFLSYGVIYAYDLFSDTPVDGIFNTVSIGFFIVLFAGAMIYPLLYIFGAEKSDAIVLGGGFVGLFVHFGVRYLLNQFTLSIDPSLYISLVYIILGIIIYILSYFIAVFIYNRKEF